VYNFIQSNISRRLSLSIPIHLTDHTFFCHTSNKIFTFNFIGQAFSSSESLHLYQLENTLQSFIHFRIVRHVEYFLSYWTIPNSSAFLYIMYYSTQLYSFSFKNSNSLLDSSNIFSSILFDN